MGETLWQTDLSGLPPPRRGKVRDIYDLGETLLIVACDRLSAYDHVLRPGIPDKGKILTQISNFWFDRLGAVVANHIVASEAADFPAAVRQHAAVLQGRSVMVRKAEVIPFECVARGYLAGSAYREYRELGTACGHKLATELERGSRLPEPIFTPATKAMEGHDENVDFHTVASALGQELAERLRILTLNLYSRGNELVASRGLILADTKFEFGTVGDALLLIDEVLTPDSSRYWDRAAWRPGVEPLSFDKQYVRNWLDDSGWDHQSPPPELPPDVVEGTRNRYLEAFRRITGTEPVL